MAQQSCEYPAGRVYRVAHGELSAGENVDAKTARNAAIGCFGLAVILGVLTTTGAFKSKYPHWCKPLKFGSWGQYIPIGHWCIDVGGGWNLVAHAQTAFDVMTADRARLRVINPSGQVMADYDAIPNGCEGPFPAYSTVTVTPARETLMYVKVRNQQESDIKNCWYTIPIPKPR